MSKLTAWLDQVCYPHHSSHWDDELLRDCILKRLKDTDIVLDIGAGTGRIKQMNFRRLAFKVIGIDPDPRVRSNPNLDEAIVGIADKIPLDNEAVDLVICDNVLEHLAEPGRVLAEVNRVLKPGGWFIAKTPNSRHYVTLISRLSPTWFHRLFNRTRGRAASDTFPTLYRINSPSEIQRLAQRAGLRVESISLIEGRPEYLRFSFFTYVIGYVYERLVNKSPRLSAFRVLLLIQLKKPAEARDGVAHHLPH